MRYSQVVFLFISCLFSASILASAQQAQSTLPTASSTPIRDTQAVAALQQALSAMGGNVPSDSTLIGAVTLVAGSETNQGSIRILTRGTTQTSVQVQAPPANWSEVYSAGQAARTDGTNTTLLPMETAVSVQSAFSPLPFIGGVLTNQDNSCQFIGVEQINAASALHILVWNTFASIPRLQFLADFSKIDIWIDAKSFLPIKVSFNRRSGGGAAPRVFNEVEYSNYQNVSGGLYPFQIQQSINGTVWASITLQSVNTNTGLTDSNFIVPQAGN